MEKIVLGLSGGVDSAVAAHLLAERGFGVTGVWLDNGVGTPDDARAVADRLNIPFETLDIRTELERCVCRPFTEAYRSGITPSPCLSCNPQVKFPALLRAAESIGAAFIATGHYARAEGGRLYRGRPANDQSYMLAYLTRDILNRTVFPLGNMEKTETRALAGLLGLSVAKKPDSMEICFIPDGDFASYIERRCGASPEGDFVDLSGRVLGRHRGIHRYTVGQRRGLGIALGERMCVVRIEPETNRVVLAPAGACSEVRLSIPRVNWIADRPTEPVRVTARIRHSKVEYPALVTPVGDCVEVMFDKPVPIPAPGQAAAFYDGEAVLGGGEIPRSDPEE